MPIHQTKLTIAKPHITGLRMPQIPTPRKSTLATATVRSESSMKDNANPTNQNQFIGALQDDRADLVGDRGDGVPRLEHRRRPVRRLLDLGFRRHGVASVSSSGLGFRSLAR